MDYDRFGPYTIHECLGTGGMATVHRATIEIGGGVVREVALKRLLPQLADDKQLTGDFIREAKLAAQLQHPNIVRILELGRAGGTYFIAMELVRGLSLLELMRLGHAMRMHAPIGIAVALLSELCDALDYASNATDVDGQPMQIVHRDLSPSNLIVADDGHIKIIDFGVARAVSGRFMTNTGMIKGKLGYMSTEVLAAAPLDHRADLFSIGVVAWELLTGRRLFSGANEYEVITKIRRGARTPPSKYARGVPPELDEIVMRALARERGDRWPSAAVMKRALDSLRRTYREGIREIAVWKCTLSPEPEFTDTTTIEVSPRDVLRPSTTGTEVGLPPADMIVDPEPTAITTDPFARKLRDD